MGSRKHSIPRKVRLKIYNRDNWTCWLCGSKVDPDAPHNSPEQASIDHYIPWSKGGRSTQDNLRTAHRGCNTERGNESWITYSTQTSTPSWNATVSNYLTPA